MYGIGRTEIHREKNQPDGYWNTKRPLRKKIVFIVDDEKSSSWRNKNVACGHIQVLFIHAPQCRTHCIIYIGPVALFTVSSCATASALTIFNLKWNSTMREKEISKRLKVLKGSKESFQLAFCRYFAILLLFSNFGVLCAILWGALENFSRKCIWIVFVFILFSLFTHLFRLVKQHR